MGRLRKHLKTKETGAAADEGKTTAPLAKRCSTQTKSDRRKYYRSTRTTTASTTENAQTTAPVDKEQK